MASTPFMEQYHDFVLKLKIEGADGTFVTLTKSNITVFGFFCECFICAEFCALSSFFRFLSEWIFSHHDTGNAQIRRIRLPRIADGQGNVSYDELVGLAVTFVFPPSNSDTSGSENYLVKLTYMDVDQDNVMIASTDELMDAIEQYSEQKVLRITSEVKPKIKNLQTNRQPNRGTLASRDSLPPIHTILESFVGVLATAVENLQDGLAKPAKAASKATANAAAKATASASKAATMAAGMAATAADVAASLGSKSAPNSKDEEKKDDANTDNTEKETATDAEFKDAQEEEEEEKKEEARPFIHGRHTCDSCLTTPIVGERYHAKNLPDYDLCGNCHEHYQGKEIEFELANLGK
jgi:hypothetical protein